MTRDLKLMVRLNDSEKHSFEQIAEKQGLNVATWARMELLRVTSPSFTNKRNGTKVAKARPLLSLFCGPGGLDLGFREAGFSTELAFDIDDECVRTFNENHAEANRRVAFAGDITKLTLEELDRLYGKTLRPIAVIGGPPCQSFSVSNVHQREDDPRHDLPVAYAVLLEKLNRRFPLSFFVFENVPGLLGDRHKERFENFKGLFRKAGFEIFDTTLDAQNFGVPQVRPRVFIVGINRRLHPDAEWAWPEPELGRQTVRHAIAELPEPIQNDRGLTPAEFSVHPNHWCMVPRSKKFRTKRALVEGQAWGRSFRTLKWDEPSWTVAYGNREVHVHPKGHRRLSIYEAMRLQSFPDWYVFTGNISAQTRLVSEAVPPRMAWHLAVAIRRNLGL
jgi:DNA (cytosine-5)-methyltransferase 1